MLTITEKNAEEIDFDEKYGLMSIIQDIAHNSGSQYNLSSNLNNLRNAAEKSGKTNEFEEIFELIFKILNEDPDFQSKGLILRPGYTFEDFQNSEAPYREVLSQPSEFLRQRALESMANEARTVGFKNFKKIYNAYLKTVRKVNESHNGIRTTEFTDQPIELDSGEWLCDDSGVRRVGGLFEEIACLHPIMPVERLVNIDTGEEKLKIAYYKSRYWRSIIAGKNELFDSSKVIKLAAVGVSVTTKSARLLSEYLCSIEGLNYDNIPEKESVSRLGYIGNGGFSPYIDSVIFDGDANYSSIYHAITQYGDFNKWLETALKCRNESVTAQIILAASFASVLIEKIGAQCFFVHLWGVESGTGKTVALMLAASVWGNPDIGGGYVQTFNATQVGHEKTAAFLNNIPMCIDELQLSKDSHGKSRFDVYQLSQGMGRARGTKTGGIDNTPKWRLCILTTGESPLTQDNSGAGAVNRVVDIECRASETVIKDGLSVTRSIRQNYGHAGRIFVDGLTNEVIDDAKNIYEQLFRELSRGSTTEKQAMAAAMLLTADRLADKIIFRSGRSLSIEQISDFLKTKETVSAGERGYKYMCDWVAMNANKFKKENENTDVYGVIIDDWAYINSSVFRKALRDQGFDDRAILSWLKTHDLILTRGRNLTRGKRINGVNVECVVMKLPGSNDDELDDINGFEEILP